MLITDEELLKNWGRSPDESFKSVYERYAGVLLRFVFRFTANQEQAEEILQDVFTELLGAVADQREGLQLKAWLFTVAKNKSLNFERKKKREVLSEDLVQKAIDPLPLELRISDSQISRRLLDFHSRLPKDLAHTWTLRKQGMDYQEIAEHLKIPLGTVKSRFSRLVDFFKKEFKVE